jgi:hypothetical protein
MAAYMATTNAQEAYATQVVDSWYRVLLYEAAYVVPILTLLGLVSICLTVGCIPRTSIGIKLKMFYILIAVFSGFSMIFLQVFYYISGVATSYFSNGTDYFYFPSATPAACKIYQFVSLVSDGGAGFVAAQLSLERLIVVAFPFRAYLLTTKCSSIVCALTLLTLAGFDSYVFYAMDLYRGEGYGEVWCYSSPETVALVSAGYVINYLLPTSFLTVLTVALAVSMKRRPMSIMARRSDDTSQVDVSTVRTTITVLVVSASRCVVYLPYSSLWAVADLITNPVQVSLVTILANDFGALSPLCAIADFAAYFTLIPSFRKCVHDAVRCRRKCDTRAQSRRRSRGLISSKTQDTLLIPVTPATAVAVHSTFVGGERLRVL